MENISMGGLQWKTLENSTAQAILVTVRFDRFEKPYMDSHSGRLSSTLCSRSAFHFS